MSEPMEGIIIPDATVDTSIGDMQHDKLTMEPSRTTEQETMAVSSLDTFTATAAVSTDESSESQHSGEDSDKMEATTEAFDKMDVDSMEVDDSDESGGSETTPKKLDVANDSTTGDVTDFDPSGKEDVLDQEKLCSLLKTNKSAADKIAGKDIILLIGGTGAGKTTSALWLAGAAFNEVDIDGKDHYEPKLPLPTQELADFAVTGGSKSVTKTIHAAPVRMKDGENVVVVDTPGFGDSAGAEMDISNGLGTVHALQATKSVKPVLVLNHRTMGYNRYQGLRETLGTVTKMMGKLTDFSSFGYIFTQCEGRSAKRVHRELSAFLRDMEVNEDEILKALVSDMICKTNPIAMTIDPLADEDAPDFLVDLWSGSERITNPADAFVCFVSQQSGDKLKLHTTHLLERLEKSLKDSTPEKSERILQKLSQLAALVPLGEAKDALYQGFAKYFHFSNQIRLEVDSIVDTAVKTKDPTQYASLTWKLRQKLSTLRKLYSTMTIHGAAVNESFAAIASKAAETLFKENQTLRTEEVRDSSEVLQSAIQRHTSLASALDDTTDGKVLKGETSRLTSKVSWIVKSELTVVEDRLAEGVSYSTSDAVKKGIIFLNNMNSFLASTAFPDNMETNSFAWTWLRDGLERIRVTLSEQGRRAKTSLETVTEAIAVLETSPVPWSAFSLELPTLDKDVMSAHFLLDLLSADEMREVLLDDTQISHNLPLEFKKSTLSILPRLAGFAQERADHLRKNGLLSANTIESTSAEATKLLEIVERLSTQCQIFQVFDPILFKEMDITLATVSTTLNGVIEDASNTGKLRIRAANQPLVELTEDEIDEILRENGGQQWYERYKELRKVRKKYGHCCVSRSGKVLGCDSQHTRSYKSLGMWIDKQRTKWTNDKLPEAYETALNRLGFIFDAAQEKLIRDAEEWNNNFEKLKEFYERNGHWPPQKPGLGKWLVNNRNRLRAWNRTGKYISKGQEHLAKERYEKMKSIGAI